MTVYVDTRRALGRRHDTLGLWSRLTADTPAELHTFATEIGLPTEWFVRRCATEPASGCPHWHYEVTEWCRAQALRAGATPATTAEFDQTVQRRGQVWA